MHCWLISKATLQDQDHVLLRGVNFDPNKTYDQHHPGVEHGVPFWHVPTVKFAYDVAEPIPSIDQTRLQVEKLIAAEWPGLQTAQIIDVDQEKTGAWGGYPLNAKTGARSFDAVTRFMLDFGNVTSLPDIKLKPGQTLPFPRHPVRWMKANLFLQYKDGETMQQGNQVSSFFVAGRPKVAMETTPGSGPIVEMTAQNILFQHTLATMLVKHQIAFSERPKGRTPHALLTASAR